MVRFAAIVGVLAAAWLFAAIIHGVGVAPPTVTSISQTQGTTAGGNAVTITGTGLGTTTAVSFGPTSAGTQWWINSPTSITVSTPAATGTASSGGTVDIRVTNIAGQSPVNAPADQFTYVVPSGIPTITSITPNSEDPAGGDAISVNGTNFNSTTSVQVGGVSATFQVFNNFNLFIKAPAGSAGPAHITVTNTAGTSSTTSADLLTYSSGPPGIFPIPTTATRPSYNTGNGFFVYGRGIYDANGNLFTPVGANWTHFDGAEDNRFAAKPNAERSYPFFRSTDTFHSSAQEGVITDEIKNFVVPIPAIFNTNYDTGGVTSGAEDIATLKTAYSFFTRDAANWSKTPFSGTSFTGNQIAWFNIANEWGPCTNSAHPGDYRIGLVGAVVAMRTAGFTAPIVVDAGCSGQSPDTIVQDAVAIEAADPLHNVIFSVHLYFNFIASPGAMGPIMGCGPPGCDQYYFPAVMGQLAQLTVPVIVGEFGCSQCQGNAGAAPVSSDQIMQTTINYGMGYLAWGWDDNNGGYYCNNSAITPTCNALQMLGTDGASNWCYKNAAGTDVTGTVSGTNVGEPYGHDVITFPTYGITAAAKVASVFTGARPAPGVCPF